MSKLANIFWLRGIPTTIILNKNKQEIARIVGDADFEDEKFIKWLNKIKNNNINLEKYPIWLKNIFLFFNYNIVSFCISWERDEKVYIFYIYLRIFK